MSSSNLSKWERAKIGDMDPKDKLFKSSKKANLPGLPSQLAAINKSLLHYISEQHEQGFVVNMFNTVLCAS